MSNKISRLSKKHIELAKKHPNWTKEQYATQIKKDIEEGKLTVIKKSKKWGK